VALAASILWHLFWFFSVTIVVSPPKNADKPKPRLVSLGPVLDDSIFRSLVESRIDATPAYYRPRLTGNTATELPAETAERRLPGDVVSVPFGTQAQNALAGLVGGRKAAPDFDLADVFAGLGGASTPAVRFTGPAEERQILFSPPKPALPPEADPAALSAPTRIRFLVDGSGAVSAAEITASSGYPEIDLLWLEYLRRFQFAPLGAAVSEKSEAVFTFAEKGE
jgi:hypothetical protein